MSDEAEVVELTVEEGRELYARACERLLPRARSGDHDAEEELHMLAPFAHRRVPWPGELFDLCFLEDIEPGMILAPAHWETAYLLGREGFLPWATVVRDPLVLKVLDAGQATWRWEAKVCCRTPTCEVMYYVGDPSEYVRVLIPDHQEVRDDDDH